MPDSWDPDDASEDRPSLRRFAKNSAYGLLTALMAGLAASFWIYLTLRMSGY